LTVRGAIADASRAMVFGRIYTSKAVKGINMMEVIGDNIITDKE